MTLRCVVAAILFSLGGVGDLLADQQGQTALADNDINGPINRLNGSRAGVRESKLEAKGLSVSHMAPLFQPKLECDRTRVHPGTNPVSTELRKIELDRILDDWTFFALWVLNYP